MDRLPLETQTLYAELLEHLVALDAARSIGSVAGTFVSKNVRGETYLYFQRSVPGGTTKQVYLGRTSPSLEALARRHRADRAARAEDEQRAARLATLVRHAGATTADATTMRVVRALAEAGVFATGAVLVGTQAFVALGNALGVRWSGAALRTHDVDVARARTLDVAVGRDGADLAGALDRLAMGFSPVPPFDPRQASTSFKVRGAALRVDVLTTQRAKETAPVLVPALGTAAQPMRYLDYLVEAPMHAAVVDGGAALVRVPQPARFALHKLLVAASRPAVMHAKVAKDLVQSAQLVEVLAADRPGDLREAQFVLVARGKRWRTALRAGVALLRARHPDAARALPRGA